MKIAQFNRFGPPAEVISCVEVADPGVPGPDEVLLDILAFPLNPADLLTLSGDYAIKPPLPAKLGAEGLGRVRALGADVDSLGIGDLVIPLGRENWVAQKLEKAAACIKVPSADPLQLSMLKVNPATAHLMLTAYVTPEPGDYVIQNAANSGVGRALFALARETGWKSIGLVRRPELIPELEAAGADHVFVDGPDVASELRAQLGDVPIRLGIDAVAGAGTLSLSHCLSDGATIVNYGMLTGEPCQLHPNDVVFRNFNLTGFWLAQHLPAMDPKAREELYAKLGGCVRSGAIHVPVAATYPIERIADAVAHAAKDARGGKVLVTPNGASAM